MNFKVAIVFYCHGSRHGRVTVNVSFMMIHDRIVTCSLFPSFLLFYVRSFVRSFIHSFPRFMTELEAEFLLFAFTQWAEKALFIYKLTTHTGIIVLA